MSYLTESPTVFCDIDGVLLKHEIKTFTCEPGWQPRLLPGSKERLIEWRNKGYKIILTTGRPASRKDTEEQLNQLGIPYDQLVMDVGAGIRVLINDRKPDGTPTAFLYNPERNQGLEEYIL